MQIPQRRSEQESRMKKQHDHYLTADAVGKLRRELVNLTERQRPRVAEEVHRTAEMGDRSENAAYQAARAQLTRINFRILEIEDQLKNAVVIEHRTTGRVEIGATVIVECDGTEHTYVILGSQETNPGRGKISHRSPLGTALMGHKAGDEVTMTVRGKVKVYRIVRV